MLDKYSVDEIIAVIVVCTIVQILTVVFASITNTYNIVTDTLVFGSTIVGVVLGVIGLVKTITRGV